MSHSTDQTAYLTLARISGDPHELLERYRSSAAVMEGVGRAHGLILHAAAQTGEGLLILNLWPSKDGSEAAARDPRRLSVLAEHAFDPGQIDREHRDVVTYVLFE